jgi:UDP-N-acetylglucosamine diphosphorylase/glucosamine-1-phosphate N-acetyltransferase
MQRTNDHLAVVILAAGLGTRMKSNKAKVLHQIDGRPMILYVVETAVNIAGENIVLVVGHQARQVQEVVAQSASVRYVLQDQQLGTGHAVACAMPELPGGCRDVLILCGDVPLVTEETVRELIADHHARRHDVTVLAMAVEDPSGYGRIVFDDAGRVAAIVEEADASVAQRNIRIVNTGIYCVAKNFLGRALQEINNDNAQRELYLTDIVAVARRTEARMGAMVAKDAQEFRGINTKNDLAAVERLMRRRRRI